MAGCCAAQNIGHAGNPTHHDRRIDRQHANKSQPLAQQDFAPPDRFGSDGMDRSWRDFTWKCRPVPKSSKKAKPATRAIQRNLFRAASRKVMPAIVQAPIKGLRPHLQFAEKGLPAKFAAGSLRKLSPPATRDSG